MVNPYKCHKTNCDISELIRVTKYIISLATQLQNKYAKRIFRQLLIKANKRPHGIVQFENFNSFVTYFDLKSFEGRAYHLWAVACVCNCNKPAWYNKTTEKKACLVIDNLTIQWKTNSAKENKNIINETENKNANTSEKQDTIIFLGVLYTLKLITFEILGFWYHAYVLSNDAISKTLMYPLILQTLDVNKLTKFIENKQYLEKQKNLYDNLGLEIDKVLLLDMDGVTSDDLSDNMKQNLVSLTLYGIKVNKLQNRNECIELLKKSKKWVVKTLSDADEFLSQYKLLELEAAKSKLLNAMNNESVQMWDEDLLNVWLELCRCASI